MSEPGNGLEPRRWNRHKIDIRLKVTARLADGTENSMFGRGNSLSRGGLGAYIPATIPLGAEVDLALTFPYSANEVNVRAVIRSCEGFRYGLEFIEVPAAVEQTIVQSCDAAEGAQLEP
jgi:hypothetical protein